MFDFDDDLVKLNSGKPCLLLEINVMYSLLEAKSWEMSSNNFQNIGPPCISFILGSGAHSCYALSLISAIF